MNTRRRLMAMNLVLVAAALTMVLLAALVRVQGGAEPVLVVDPVFQAFVTTTEAETAVAAGEAPPPAGAPTELPELAGSPAEAPLGG